jgi:negative regulator of flagellin synthesis FlgM
MSTKIDSSASLPLSLPLSTDKLAAAKTAAKAAYGSADTGATSASTRGDDTVQITGDAMNLHSAAKSIASSSSSFDSKRVEAVRQSIASGSYKVNPERIASRMIDSDAALA